MTKQLFEQAQEAHQSGDFKKALTLYQTLLYDDPNNPELHHIIGILYAQLGEYSNAIEHVEKAIQLKPQSSFYNSLGNIYLRQKNFDKAIHSYQSAIDLNEDYGVAYSNLGNCYYQTNQMSEARIAYEKAISINPALIDALYNYAILLSQQGELDLAIEQLNKVLEISPQYAAAYGQLAELYLAKEDYDKTVEYCDKRLELQPNHAGSFHTLGLALYKLKQFKEAVIAFDAALENDKDIPDGNQNLANAFLYSGDHQKALTHYLRQLEIEPLAETYYNIGVIMMLQEHHQEALQYLEYAAKKDPNYIPTHLNLGAIYLKMGRIEDAIKHYETANEINPEDLEIKHILTALLQNETPQSAPKDYLQHLFDQYANYYDKHLTEHLRYQAPQLMLNAFTQQTGLEIAEWTVLDLGCGTGLCGELFKPFAKELIGIDISKKMIEIAQEKNIYDTLEVSDIDSALKRFSDIDLILAADVFTYIGDLDAIFSKITSALKPHGIFIFTAEKTDLAPYTLQQNIRYAHSRDYLDALISKYAFETLVFDTIVMRQQQRKPVEGYLVMLKKLFH